MSDDYTAVNVPGRWVMDKDAEITRLRAELAAALAECERINKSRNRWGKKYNDCLGKLRLAVMSDSDECKELTAQNNNLRTDLAAVTAERDRMREAVKKAYFEGWWTNSHKYIERDSEDDWKASEARFVLERATEPNIGS